MTKQQRLTIRAELARRMGWTENGGRWVEPGKAYTGRYGNSSLPIQPPDPFTSAADKDALVKWLASQGANCRTKFIKHLARSIKIEYGVMEGWSLLSAHEESGADWNDFFLLLTASLETVTLAAARALGIGEAE